MGLFSKEKFTPFEDIRSAEAKELGTDYLTKLKSAISQYDAGADFGDVSVGLTDPEQLSLGYLAQYGEGDITESDLYQLGRGEITDTLSGAYDPATGEFYQGARSAMEFEEQQAIDRARRGQAARGAFRSSGGLRQESDILAETTARKQALLGQLAERERERRTAAGQQAIGLAKFESDIPLTKAAALQRYGALERQNEIMNLEREYTKWQNQRQELQAAFSQAGQASNYGQPIYGKTGVTTRETTGLGKIAQVGLTAAGAYFGGPAGAQMGYQIGGGLQSSGL